MTFNINTVNALNAFKAIAKSSNGKWATTKQLVALELATLSGTYTFATQALQDFGNLSDLKRDLRCTITHLFFAVTVPFGLIYPKAINYTAQVLDVLPPPDTQSNSSVKIYNLTKNIVRKSRQLVAHYPLTTSSILSVGLASIGLIAQVLNPIGQKLPDDSPSFPLAVTIIILTTIRFTCCS